MTDVLRLKAGDLSEALVDALPKRRKKQKQKPSPVSLEFYEAVSKLAVIEAKNGAFQNVLAASGEWPREVQVDGAVLARVLAAHPPDAELELHVDTDNLEIRNGASTIKLARLDSSSGKAIKRKPQEQDPRHMGMPKGIDEPLQPTEPQKDTWDFSAHMVLTKKDK